MRCLLALILILALEPTPAQSADASSPTMLIVVGAAGEESYATRFDTEAETLRKACVEGGVNALTIGSQASETNSLDLFKQAVSRESSEEIQPLWIVMLGHGSFDGREAKFNLRGNDLTATELAAWLKPFKRPLIVINAAASSGPFLAKLSAPGRVVITATRSGAEQNYAHFGEYFADALIDPKADLDKDGQTSLLEAFLSAARKTAEFFEGEGRLATEHALIDDNGDGLGTQADWFHGLRVVKKAKEGAGPDGLRAHQIHLVPSAAEKQLPPTVRSERDSLELEIAKLREQKENLPEDEYYAQMETLLVKLGRLYESAAKSAK